MITKAIQLPGATAFDAELTARLTAALAKQGPDYVPRTHHLEADGAPRFINRLIFETSPYLLQHAHNPVSWMAWGPEAFALAAKLDRPILLSVGYSTCHWCHVMERESFEDEEIAGFINQHFIAIKVDREERPDVDSVYMTAVQMMTGRGGWPMTVVMTPDRRPFFGGTYFPARDGDRGTRLGFLSILKRLNEAYTTQRAEVVKSAAEISSEIARRSQREVPSDMPPKSALHRAAAALASRFDPEYGGFGRAPKFPRPSTYELLLRYARRARDPGALHIVTHSLRNMADGGIYDHLGGGFARYSTDQRWLVPHFEKMLYDNAQLATLLVETWQASQDPRFEEVARDTLDYVLAEMTSDGGGFYSATDADSEGEEGKFFVWTPKELTEVLGDDLAQTAIAYWGVTEAGNFEGHNILNRPRTDEQVATALQVDLPELRSRIATARKKLYEARAKRIPPLLDDKILTEWNGQMISAMARAGWAFGEPRYVEAAAKAANFVLERLTRDGRLLRAYRAGEGRHGAVLEDYAFFIAGLLDLFEATAEPKWLDAAVRLQAVLEEHHLDDSGGGFFETPDDGEALLIREKPTYDGAQPSGNSVAALNLLRLGELKQTPGYRETALRALLAQGEALAQGALENPKMALAFDWYLDEAKEIAIVTTDEDDGSALQAVLRKTFLPNKVALTVHEDRVEAMAEQVPWLEGKRPQKGRATAYVCKAQVCDKPTSNPKEFATQLAEVEALEAPPLKVERRP